MAEATGTNMKIELRLEALNLMVKDLPNVADDWNAMPKSERASWSLDWDQIMGDLEAVLIPAYLEKAMTVHQQARYLDLLSLLQTHTSVIDRLGLSKPRLTSA